LNPWANYSDRFFGGSLEGKGPPSLRGGGLDWLIPEGGEDPVLGQEGLQKRR